MAIGPLTRQGALTLKSGDKITARVQLMQALDSGESADEVWYWLAMAADVIDEKRTYLTKALDANPLNEDARKLLAQITGSEADSRLVKAGSGSLSSAKAIDYEYLVLPFQGKLQTGGSAAEVSKQLQTIINTHSTKGWEFVTINDVNIEVNPGCLSALLGARTSYVTYDQVVYRRPESK